MKPKSDVELLAFLWGAIFAAGLWAAAQYVVLWTSWANPPTVADFVGTLAFAAIAIVLLTPSSLVLWEIGTGRFAELVEEARKEARRR